MRVIAAVYLGPEDRSSCCGRSNEDLTFTFFLPTYVYTATYPNIFPLQLFSRYSYNFSVGKFFNDYIIYDFLNITAETHGVL